MATNNSEIKYKVA